MSTTKVTAKHYDVCWMIRGDMPEVCAIEGQSFEFPWTEEEFIRCLRQRDTIGSVVRIDDRVVGFMVYSLYPKRLHLLSLAVHPEYRRHGVGHAMATKLISKLAFQRRNRIVCEVRESNLVALNFLKKAGFLATGILKDHYEDSDEDAYQMMYRVAEKVPCTKDSLRPS